MFFNDLSSSFIQITIIDRPIFQWEYSRIVAKSFIFESMMFINPMENK